MRRRLLLTLLARTPAILSAAAEDESTARRQRAQLFHLRAQQRTGILVPLYVYPGDVRKNPAFTRLIDLKRKFETVPMWVIVNPASGPGKKVDPNYTTAINRLLGAGCVVLGYVSTSYGKRTEAAVRQDIDQWAKLYPRVQGIFFDEMIYTDTAEAVKHQLALNSYAHKAGYWPTVGNPGADTPGRYFADEAADVIVIHEGNTWPKEDRLKGDRAGGYADYPPFTRAVLIHSQAKFDAASLKMARKYVRWVYVTEGVFRPKDPKAANPWDRLSAHMGAMCEQLAGN